MTSWWVGLEFPQALPDAVQTSAAVSAAQADAQSTRLLAIVGIAVGVLGLLAVAAVWLSRPRLTVAGRRPTAESA